jgi:hypothetical protein
MNERLEKDAAFYWSVCLLRRLRDMGLITTKEYEKIRDMSASYYGTKLLCV